MAACDGFCSTPARVFAICAGLELLELEPEDVALYSLFGDARALPQGEIVGLALLGLPFEYNPALPNSRWARGKYCYPIRDCIRVPEGFKHKGNTMFTSLDPLAIEFFQTDPTIRARLEEWGALNATIMGLTVRQPAAEAIVSGKKNIENRSRVMFSNKTCDVTWWELQS